MFNDAAFIHCHVDPYSAVGGVLSVVNPTTGPYLLLLLLYFCFFLFAYLYTNIFPKFSNECTMYVCLLLYICTCMYIGAYIYVHILYEQYVHIVKVG